jgi:hypothetical protein
MSNFTRLRPPVINVNKRMIRKIWTGIYEPAFMIEAPSIIARPITNDTIGLSSLWVGSDASRVAVEDADVVGEVVEVVEDIKEIIDKF